MNGTTPRKKTNITRTKPLPPENNNENRDYMVAIIL